MKRVQKSNSHGKRIEGKVPFFYQCPLVFHSQSVVNMVQTEVTLETMNKFDYQANT